MSPRSLLGIVLAAAGLVGCDGPLTLSQRLEGKWVGRPETATERVTREWPTGQPDADAPADPELERALRETPPTDLEAFGNVAVSMRLSLGGQAELTLGGGTQSGVWSVEAGEGARAVLDLAVSPSGGAEGRVRRRYVVDFVDTGGFTLSEQGADRRFGRLLFEPAE